MRNLKRLHSAIAVNRGILALFFGLTLLDILVIELYYRPLQIWGEISQYHVLYLTLQYGLPLLWAVKDMSWRPLQTWLLWYFGLEDTAFYLLQGKIPERFWGVSIMGVWEPSWNWVLSVNLIGLTLLLLLNFGLSWALEKSKPPPLNFIVSYLLAQVRRNHLKAREEKNQSD